MTPAAQAPGRPPCAGASQADVSTTTTAGLGTSSDVSLVGSSGRSWTVRLRAAHLLVAVRPGEWWDDALACLPAGAGSGGPTGPTTRRGWVAGATEHEPSGAPSRPTPGGRLSAVGGESDAAGAGAELRGRDLAVVDGVDADRVGDQWAKLLSERMPLWPPPNLRTKRPRRSRQTAYRQPPPRRDSPPYRRPPRCTPGGGGVGPPRRLSSATSRAAVSRACASAEPGSRPRPSSVGVRCAAPSPCR